MSVHSRLGVRTACVLAAAAVAATAIAAPGHAVAAGSWTTPTSLPVALNSPAVAVGHDGNLYVFGGTDGHTQDYNTTYAYDPTTGTWTPGATMSQGVEGASAVTLPDGRIVVMGGGTGCHYTQTCTIYNTVSAYRPATHSWTQLASMLSPRYRFAALLGRDGRIYAIGGWNGSTALSSVEAYDPATNSWSYVASLPQAAEELAGAITRGGAMVVMGGVNGSNYYNNVYKYNGSAWISRAPMPTPRNGLTAALAPSGQIFAMGGYNPSSGYLTTVEAYDPRANQWTTAPSLPSAMALFAATQLPSTGQIYAIGGWNGVASAQVAVYS